jgi:hypothetical protein
MTAIPGTHEPGFVEERIIEYANPLRERLRMMGSRGVKTFRMGACSIIKAREPAGTDNELLWHLTISHPDRHPTWDEIKVARYRLLPLDRCFGMLLPPPEYYVNVEEQDHVFQLWEVTDPRAVWTTG